MTTTPHKIIEEALEKRRLEEREGVRLPDYDPLFEDGDPWLGLDPVTRRLRPLDEFVNRSKTPPSYTYGQTNTWYARAKRSGDPSQRAFVSYLRAKVTAWRNRKNGA